MDPAPSGQARGYKHMVVDSSSGGQVVKPEIGGRRANVAMPGLHAFGGCCSLVTIQLCGGSATDVEDHAS